MGTVPQNTETVNATVTSFNHYPRPIQLKLYQAFIFSIPVLFSVILILLFYLFYLKRRSANLPSTPRDPPTSTHGSPFGSFDEVGFKEMQIRLPKVILDEDLREKDPLCSVCLGEYEMKEELVQVRVCKHLFHIECINHWLQSNATCPLCRSSVLSSSSSSSSSIFLSKSTPQPSNSLVDEASSSSPPSSASSVIIARDFNDHQIEPPVALNIIVQN